ncbi:partner of Y14 and mago-like isoform X3 [Physella acuta]|uniref:partner of Y14 and mago-like isoform X3 n=1 Tax=Physella acuta TaxID=109671 RepID=UPI0027DB89B8|nr:partner of Y14 and mago-like isoform X3 [Physella acuta]
MATNQERAGVIRDEKTGELILPATQRPDGTWRKPRRVKDGYIPQEEVPAYETKGTQWAKSKPDYPIGLSPVDVEKMRQAKSKEASEPDTHVSKSSKKNAKRKEKRKQQQNTPASISSVDSASAALSKARISPPEQVEANNSQISQEEIVKKIKSLKKKLRQIEDLEAKIASGSLSNPEKEQLEKIERKKYIIDEINDLELDLE